MKIVYVFPQLARLAGTERILIDKMNYLADQYGYDIFALTYDQGNAPDAYQLSQNVVHVDFNIKFWKLYRFNRLRRYWEQRKKEKILYQRFMSYISDIRPDILIATPYHEVVLRMAVRCPFPTVRIIESHQNKRFNIDKNPIIDNKLIHRVVARFEIQRIENCVRHFDCLVALNQADADDWSKYVKTQVITNMVHLNDGAVSTLNEKRVIFVGRYTKQKGIPDLFRIWKLVHGRHANWHLDLYGEVDEEYLFACKESERLGMNIHVHRGVNDIFEKYRESSIFVLTSIYEPFGLVIPEAMSCGLPVVAFDCPYGPKNIISDGKDGFLIGNRGVERFADRICQLIEDVALRQQMGKNGMASSQRFSADKIMPKWKELFESLLSANK